jgi:Zn finger protein HypA/HybF involved in hydrogenase expression
MEKLKLDGNAAAGALQAVFAVEMTTTSGTCDNCGAVNLVGEVVLYAKAPGLVMRCPTCDSVLMKIVTDGERYWVDMRGVRTLELPA